MQQPQQRLEHRQQGALRSMARGRVWGLQHRFDDLEIPVAELVPGELIERAGGEIEAVLVERALDRADRGAQARADPAIGHVVDLGAAQWRRRPGRRGGRRLLEREHHETRGVPQLVAEIAIAGHPAQIETQVPALRGEGCEREAQCVGAVGGDALRVLSARRLFDRGGQMRLHQSRGALGHERIELDAIDDVQRIDDIALGLGHLLPFGIEDQAVQVDGAERHFVQELQPEHQHAGDPEEDDVEARDQHAGGIVAIEFRGLPGPAQG